MIKFIYLIIFTFLSSVAFSSNKQIIPNGNYEFTWKIYYPDNGKIELLATDYVEINDKNVNFIHMPLSLIHI